MSKKKSEVEGIEELSCVYHGGNPIRIANYYMATEASIYKGVGYIPICKRCIYEMIEDYYEKHEDVRIAVYHICRKLDIAFHTSIFNSAFEGNKIKPVKAFQQYMRQYNSLGDTNNAHLPFDEGEHIGVDNIQSIEASHEIKLKKEATTIQVTPEIVMSWGKGMEDWEYEFLEDELYRLKTDFECGDYSMEMIMKDIAFINFDIYKERIGEGDAQSIGRMIKTRSDLMTDANLKPVQSTGADKNEKVSLGVFIKKWENEHPIDEKIDDEMKTYIDTHMAGHLAKMQGYDNELTQKYEESIEEYSIDFEDLYADDGEE